MTHDFVIPEVCYACYNHPWTRPVAGNGENIIASLGKGGVHSEALSRT